MSEKKAFTQEKMDTMGKTHLERANAAIDAGDAERAKKEIQGMWNEFQAMHDSLRDWIAALYSWIYRNHGDDALYEANYEAFLAGFKGLTKLYQNAAPGHQAAMLAAGYRGHLVPLKVEEDDEKFTITMLPCGSGGRLAKGGGYDPPLNLARVKKAQPQTYMQENFPIYCTHCAFQEIIPIDLMGHPIFITDPPAGDKIGEEYCRAYIYKDPKDIPEVYYTRIGKKKPIKP